MRIWTTAEEAERLQARFADIGQAEFARKHKIPGGASMLSQHIKGRRPLNLQAATAYAAGFGVPLEEISPRLAAEVAATQGLARAAAAEIVPRDRTVFNLMLRLGELLTPLDEADREQAEVLLRKLATQPEKGDQWAAKLARLLGEFPSADLASGQRAA
jgi:hypothetical protein